MGSGGGGAMSISPYLTTEEAAAYLRYSGVSSIHEKIQSGELVPDGRRGKKGAYLFRRETLDAWLEACAGQPRPAPLEVSGPAMGIGEDDETSTRSEATEERPLPDPCDSQGSEDWKAAGSPGHPRARCNTGRSRQGPGRTTGKDRGEARTAHGPRSASYYRRTIRLGVGDEKET